MKEVLAIVKKQLFRIFLALSLLLSGFVLHVPDAYAQGNVYYVDSLRPDDSGDGLSPATAWRSLDKVNATVFVPGDQILLKAGGTWSGQLYPKGSGTAGSPIVIGSYGTGNKPIINGNGLAAAADGTGGAAVYLYNQEYWEIRDLEVTNTGSTAVKRYGVSVVAADYGTARYIHLLNLTVHDVNGINSDRKNGGISVQALGSTVSTKFDDVLIDNCTVYTVDRTGITLHSRWMNRGGIADAGPWNPWTNVIVQNNTIYDTGGDGIVVRVAQSPLIQYNTTHDINVRSGDANVGMWPFNTDDAVVQYNEAYLTRTTKDGQGFDSDYNTNRTIIQYNYSHDNEGGFLLICSAGNGNFNNDTIARYNISQNDLTRTIQVIGNVKNASIYNNTFYIGSSLSTRPLLFDNWNGYPDGTTVKNNIFYNLGSGGYLFTSSTNNSFDSNVFYGNHPASEPADANKLVSDPMLASPGSGGTGRDTVGGYKLLQGSPAIDSGVLIANNGGKDYWGNPVPYNGNTDRGANEGPGLAVPQPGVLLQEDFEAGTAAGWSAINGAWSIVANGTGKAYAQTNSTGEAIATAGSNWGNYTYSAKVSLSNAFANAGILFRYTDAGNYYMFRLNHANQKAELYKKTAQSGLVLIQSVSFAHQINQWYILEAAASGSRIICSIGGNQLIDWTNPASELAGGSIGFRMSGSTAKFDDVLVTSIALFQDDFSTGNAGNWAVSSGTWNVVQDETYALNQSNASGEAFTTAGSGLWTAYSFSARMKLLNQNANGGLLFRVTDSNNYYMFRLNSNTKTADLYKKVNGTLTLASSVPFTSGINTWYTLKAAVTGNQISCFVDNTAVIQWTNPSTELISGKIGFRTSGSTANFDDALVLE
ncbi:hypothetical protein D3C75_500070 [compost metagenome]